MAYSYVDPWLPILDGACVYYPGMYGGAGLPHGTDPNPPGPPPPPPPSPYIPVIPPKPKATFSVRLRSEGVLEVIDTSYIKTGPPKSQSWSFGDGAIVYNVSRTSHKYVRAGIYYVSHTVVTAGGSNTITAQISIKISPRQTFIDAQYSGMTVYFGFYGNYDPVSYLWNFGDGTTSTSASPSHTYSSNNTYNVTLTTDGLTGSNSNTGYATIVINNQLILNWTNNSTGEDGTNIYYRQEGTATWIYLGSVAVAGATQYGVGQGESGIDISQVNQFVVRQYIGATESSASNIITLACGV